MRGKEAGVTLIMVLIFTFLLSVVAMGMIGTTLTEAKSVSSRWNADQQKQALRQVVDMKIQEADYRGCVVGRPCQLQNYQYYFTRLGDNACQKISGQDQIGVVYYRLEVVSDRSDLHAMVTIAFPHAFGVTCQSITMIKPGRQASVVAHG